ncbi:MAG TPA: ABC transporter permease [Microbacterium sp.]|uniref:ABC transporter permease n=1 Tax=Microbacterium sp. TaxID=51671 RepID=UPI002BF73B83|nr:ABC transporter permease [Microbacterium sp.]HWI32294.1 ABC transporter permease [Microbacterium sp.]
MDRKGRIGVGILVAYILIAIVGPSFTQDPLQQNLLNRLAFPSPEHWLGTDALGRDVLARMVSATQLDLRFGILAMLVPLFIGTTLGTLAGTLGGAVDAVIMRIADLVQSFPVILLFLGVAAASTRTESYFLLGPGELPILIVFALVGWVVYARLVRGEILRVKGMDYIAAAYAGGLSRPRVMLRHLLPNAISQTVVYAVVDVGLAVLSMASISYLGLGVPAPIPEWGSMINEGQVYLAVQWWLVVAPGLAIAGLGIGLALIGDSLDDGSSS